MIAITLVQAARSAWSRRYALSLVVLSIALSTFLLLAVERLRADLRESFTQAVSGTDLVVGPRTGAIQLLLYSVFRIGYPAQNLSWASLEALEAHPAVAWVLPISLGDSHRGFPVVATRETYFKYYRFGDRQALSFSQGRPFSATYELVLGAEIAARLGYRLGDSLVLSHGDGAFESSDHAAQPFTVVGILARTGTPVDRSLHISLGAMNALHSDEPERASQASPPSVTAALIGLKERAAVFSVQRWVARYQGEALMAILPGVVLDELWQLIGLVEQGLLALSALVALVSVFGLMATILAGLSERRRELAVLRALGARPRHLYVLLGVEGAMISALGVVLGAALVALVVVLGRDPVQAALGITLGTQAPGIAEWLLALLVFACGLLASLIPAHLACRQALHDGLAPRS